VIASVTANVARTQEEADIQATGKTVAELRAEEERAAEDEIAELFDEIGAAADESQDPRERANPDALGGDPRDG
jgi:large subunit ribosomal protein L9